jgi:hypothetical protein
MGATNTDANALAASSGRSFEIILPARGVQLATACLGSCSKGALRRQARLGPFYNNIQSQTHGAASRIRYPGFVPIRTRRAHHNKLVAVLDQVRGPWNHQNRAEGDVCKSHSSFFVLRMPRV